MSVTPNTTKSTTPAGRPAPTQSRKVPTFLFDRSNYVWMIGGLALIFLGLILMAGGKSPDPSKFDAADLYSFRRITLAPILIIIGMIVEGYAIMKKPASSVIGDYDTTNNS